MAVPFGCGMALAAGNSSSKPEGERLRGRFDLVYFVSETTIMLSWAIVFLIVALVAALFGFTGIAGTAVNIAWILAVIGIIAAVVFFVLGRRP
jgi:uncharacterized membrane protein YtjA (UPF0391 family)